MQVIFEEKKVLVWLGDEDDNEPATVGALLAERFSDSGFEATVLSARNVALSN